MKEMLAKAIISNQIALSFLHILNQHDVFMPIIFQLKDI